MKRSTAFLGGLAILVMQICCMPLLVHPSRSCPMRASRKCCKVERRCSTTPAQKRTAQVRDLKRFTAVRTSPQAPLVARVAVDSPAFAAETRRAFPPLVVPLRI